MIRGCKIMVFLCVYQPHRCSFTLNSGRSVIDMTAYTPDYHIRVTRSLADIDPQAWDALLQPEAYFCHRYLQALAASQLHCEFLYAVAEHQGQLVAFSFGYMTQFPV